MTPIELIRESLPEDKLGLYPFFDNVPFWELHSDVKLEPSIWRGIPSKWSLRFSDNTCIKEVFRIDDPSFCGKYAEAISGGGQERQKIHTLHSSSLAALLLLQHVSKKNPISVHINGRHVSFTECHFEHKNQVSEDDPHNFSNVDIMLVDKAKKTILFLESKFSEYLKREPMSFSYTPYYMKMYDSLGEELKGFGIQHRQTMEKNKNGKEQDVIRLEHIEKDKRIYCEGIKQMISQFMGVSTECRKGTFDGKNVYLGEILFDFGELVPDAFECLSSYRGTYESLRNALNEKKAGTQFEMLGLMIWQDLLHDKSNKKYLETLDDDIKTYYRL